MSDGEIVPISDAAQRIGRQPWWLRRYLRDYETRTGHSVLVRKGRGQRRPTYEVHMGRLRSMCPELFDARDQLAVALQRSVIVGNAQVAKISEEIGEVRENVELLLEAVRRIAAR